MYMYVCVSLKRMFLWMWGQSRAPLNQHTNKWFSSRSKLLAHTWILLTPSTTASHFLCARWIILIWATKQDTFLAELAFSCVSNMERLSQTRQLIPQKEATMQNCVLKKQKILKTFCGKTNTLENSWTEVRFNKTRSRNSLAWSSLKQGPSNPDPRERACVCLRVYDISETLLWWIRSQFHSFEISDKHVVLSRRGKRSFTLHWNSTPMNFHLLKKCVAFHAWTDR